MVAYRLSGWSVVMLRQIGGVVVVFESCGIFVVWWQCGGVAVV